MRKGSCIICGHESLDAIDRALAGGVSTRKVAEQYSLNPKTVWRHGDLHLSPAQRRVEVIRRAAPGDRLAQAEVGLVIAEAVMTGAYRSGRASLALQGVRAHGEALERVVKLEMAAKSGQTVNVLTDPGFQSAMETVREVLAAHPDAARDFATRWEQVRARGELGASP